MKFHYKAQAKTGFIIEDIVDAESKEAVLDKLKTNGATPITVEEVKKKGLSLSVPFLDSLFGGVRLSDKIVFAKNLSRMVKAGLSLSRALEVLKKQSKKEELLKIIDALIKEINTGGTLSSGLAKFPKTFSPLFVAMTHAGEESGNISDNLLAVSKQLEKTYRLQKKVKGAMIYPGVILSAMLLIGILMFIFVVPTLISTFKDFNLDLPFTTRVVVFLSDFIQHHTLLFFAGLIGLIALVVGVFRMQSLKKYIHFFILKIPVVGLIVRQMNSALAARTLSSLLHSGLSVNEALSITKDVVQNVRYKETFDIAKKYIEQGAPLSKIFQERTDLYPLMLGEMVEVGEETGNLVDMLKDVAVFYESEVNSKTKNLSTIIEPVLMIIIGAAVGFFAIAMMTPMYSLVQGF